MSASPSETAEPRNARVSVVRLTSYESSAVSRAVEMVLDPLGGIARFVRPGDRVVLKPNFLRPAGPDRAVCTHPEIIRAVGRMACDAIATEVVVTDSPGIGTAKRCARRLGIDENREPFSVLDADDGVDVDTKRGAYHRLKMSKRMIEADVLINLPKVKTHGQMVLTGAVKNTFGAVVGLEKTQWHMRSGRDPMDFARLLVHVHRAVSPKLNIVDGVIGMEGNGPGAGDPRLLGMLLASDHAHALDIVLCRILGINPDDVFTIVVAKQLGLLVPEARIEVLGDRLESLAVEKKWQLARPLLPSMMTRSKWMAPLIQNLLTVEPRVDRKTCTACEQCVEICAPQAMTLAQTRRFPRGKIVVDKDKCISCFCCQETCPSGAISVKAGLMARMLGLGVR